MSTGQVRIFVGFVFSALAGICVAIGEQREIMVAVGFLICGIWLILSGSYLHEDERR
jgi:cobalamin synthase